MATVLEIARSYVAAGLSVIPVRADGTKSPGLSRWKEYQGRLPTGQELASWFADDRVGIAVICGRVSGGLEVLDFDRPGLFEPWAEQMAWRAPGLVARLPQVKTPGGGMHVYYRCLLIEGNQKVTMDPARVKTWIETRGEGGYVLAPGSPAACHPTGGVYLHVAGPPITETPIIDGF